MSEATRLILCALAGAGLAVLFFGGLWWTVRRSMTSKWPGLWVFISLIVRMAMILTGFYLVAGGHWQRLVACLIGLVAARTLLTRLILPASGTCSADRSSPRPESPHAS